MAYQVYEIYRNSIITSNYGTYVKSIADEIASTVPGITLESITTDTTSVYDAIYTIEGMTECKLRIYNSTSTMEIRVGNDVNSSSSTASLYYYKTIALNNINNLYKIQFIVSDGMYFLTLISSGSGSNLYKLAFGLLTSKIDGSKIEIRQDAGEIANYSGMMIMKDGNAYRLYLNNISIGYHQARTLPFNTIYFNESVLYTSLTDANMAPYGINGHSIYTVYYKFVNGCSDIVTDGNNCFYLINNFSDGDYTYAFRLI